MELCKKYNIYCPFYINKKCGEKKEICGEWRKTYNIFKNNLKENDFKKLEKILMEKKSEN